MSKKMSINQNSQTNNNIIQSQENNEPIDVDLLQSLLPNDVIDLFTFFPHLNILKIRLKNGNNDPNLVIISTSPARSDWNKFSKNCRKLLEQKNIKKNHIDVIINSIDLNYEIILGISPGMEFPIEDKNNFRSSSNLLLEAVQGAIELYFVDQYNEAYVRVNIDNGIVDDLRVTSQKFSKFLFKCFYEKYGGQLPNREAINSVSQVIQAKAEFGNVRYSLSLRVAEYEGDIYYDIVDSNRRCIKISKKGKSFEILNQTPVPLFRRYNQTEQDVSLNFQSNEIGKRLTENISFESNENPLDEFLTKMTNLKNDDENTRLLIKAALISYFVPNISHPIIILHGSPGSAKSTLQSFVKNIVDPSKPSLLTLHSNTSEFIQQLAHNYLATYDNLKYTPYWLADEVCRAVTGIGQTKRALYTDDEDKIYEYQHCLIFNGINIAFSEPDVLARSIVIHLDEIDDDKRKTEKELHNDFFILRPSILRFIFETLSQSLLLKNKVLFTIRKLPRLADFAIWGEAILQSWGYKEGKFLEIYYENMNRQNEDVIDSTPLAFAVQKLVEELQISPHSTEVLFKGTSMEMLDELNRIASERKINTLARDWPKDVRWLIKRIKMVKLNLQKALGIRIIIGRDTIENTSQISILKNNSGNSAILDVSPNIQDLTLYLDNSAPQNPNQSSNDLHIDPDTKKTGVTGVILHENSIDISNNKNERSNQTDDLSQNLLHLNNGHNPIFDSNIVYDEKTKLYHCKQHPEIKNIHYNEIADHLQNSPKHSEKSYLHELRRAL